MRLFLKEIFFQKFMFFSKKFFLRFLSLRYGADFGRSRLVELSIELVDLMTMIITLKPRKMFSKTT